MNGDGEFPHVDGQRIDTLSALSTLLKATATGPTSR